MILFFKKWKKKWRDGGSKGEPHPQEKVNKKFKNDFFFKDTKEKQRSLKLTAYKSDCYQWHLRNTHGTLKKYSSLEEYRHKICNSESNITNSVTHAAM